MTTLVAGLKLTGVGASRSVRDDLVQEQPDQGGAVAVEVAGTWPRQPGGGAVRRAAAAAVHCPVAGDPAAGAADG